RPQPPSRPPYPAPARAAGSRARGERPRRARGPARLEARFGQPRRVHVTEAILAPLRERYGEPALLEWEGEISEREHSLATYDPQDVPWHTHGFLATTQGERLAPRDREEIAAARWGTLAELAGPLRERLLETGRAFWRYRVALHDAALDQLQQLR